MATKRRRPAFRPTEPLIRTPNRIGSLDAAATVGELRELHEAAGDLDIGTMPADDELYGALLYAEKHRSALDGAGEEVQRAAALKRVLLCEYLREQAEAHQTKAIEAARTARAGWAQLAPVLAVGGASAAYNKAARLRALTLTGEAINGQVVRRTPEAVVSAERRIAARAVAQRCAEEAARRRHAMLVPVARRLVEHRASLLRGDLLDYWLDEVAAVLEDCQTSTQKLSLRTYLEAAVRELTKAARGTDRAVARTSEALSAYAAAVEICSK